MARFDVYTTNYPNAPLVVDVQADILADLHTRTVVPLVRRSPDAREKFRRLHPILRLGDGEYMMVTHNIGALHVTQLIGPTGNLEDQRTAIIDAVDFLLQGF